MGKHVSTRNFSIKRKRPKINDKVVIGFDETHNGLHLNKEHRLDLPFVITGYLVKNYQGRGLQGHNSKYGRKCGAFNKKNKGKGTSIEDRAVGFLKLNPNFLYSKISREEYQKDEIFSRARAISSITLKFIEKYNLNESDLRICIDRPNDLSFAEDVDEMIYDHFKIANLFPRSYQNHVYFQDQADDHNVAARLADRCGYYLLALKFRTERSKWPHRDQLVNGRDFLNLVFNRMGLND